MKEQCAYIVFNADSTYHLVYNMMVSWTSTWLKKLIKQYTPDTTRYLVLSLNFGRSLWSL
ncbi:MAG: hypothetical protein ACJAZ0_001508 [Halioglobus sp.]|jgi:hypothetical protein